MIADIGGSRFEWGSRTYVMGIINTTPDSFSGDGLGTNQDQAVAQGLRMVREGADMLDVGGESTRPGHQPVIPSEEVARTEAVVARLAREATVPISIDTYKLEVAEAAVAAGATIVNDIWGLTRAPALRASATYAWPSACKPSTATNRSPGLTRRESYAMPLISTSPFPSRVAPGTPRASS